MRSVTGADVYAQTNDVVNLAAVNTTSGKIEYQDANALTVIAAGTGIGAAHTGDFAAITTGVTQSTPGAGKDILLKTLNGTLTLNNDVLAGTGLGDVRLFSAATNITQAATGSKITANTLGLRSVTGADVYAQTNDAVNLAANNSGAGTLKYQDATALTVSAAGIAAAHAGDFAAMTTGVSSRGQTGDDITMQAGGLVTVDQTVNAGAAKIILTSVGATNNSSITAAGGITINAGTGLLTNTSSATRQGIITNGGGATATAITLIADDMDLQTGGAAGNSKIVGGAGTVTLTAATDSQPITIGAGLGGLGLSANPGVTNPDEINTVSTTGQLTIGSAAHTAAITVDGNASINNSTAQTLLFQNQGPIIVNAQLTANPVGGPIIKMDTPDSIAGGGLIGADSYTIIQSGGIGSIVTPLQTNVNKLTAFNNVSGNVVINNAKTVTLVNVFGNSAPGGEARLSTTNGDIITGNVNITTNNGRIVLTANDQGAGGNIYIGPAVFAAGAGGINSGSAPVILHAADTITVHRPITTTGGINGNVEMIAGTGPGILLNPTPALVNPATETTADDTGTILLNAQINTGTGNTVLVTSANGTVGNTAGGIVQTASGAILTNTLTAVTLRGLGTSGGGGAPVTLDKATGPMNSTSNINLFACTYNGCPDATPPAMSRSGAPFQTATFVNQIGPFILGPLGGRYADGPLAYTSSTGTNLTGIGTLNDIAFFTLGNFSMSAVPLTARFLTLEASGNIDITLSGPVTNADIATGGTLKLVAGQNINFNPSAAGNTIGTPGATFDRNLIFTSAGDINLNNAIYIGAAGSLVVNANQSGTMNGGTVPYTATGAGSVSMGGNHEIRVGGNFTLNAINLSVLGGNSDVNSQVLGERLNVNGTATFNVPGNILVQANTQSPIPGGLLVSDSAAIIQANTINIGSPGARVNGLYLNNDVTVNGVAAGSGTSNVTNTSASQVQHSDAQIKATGLMNVYLGAGGLNLTGGSATVALSATNAAQATATAGMQAGTITLDIANNGNLSMKGGTSNAYGGVSALSTDIGADASANIVSTGVFAPVITGFVSLKGGDATAAPAGAASAHALASALIKGTSIILTVQNNGLAANGLTLTGGTASATASPGSGICGGGGGVCATANALLSSDTDKTISVTHGNIHLEGGSNANADGVSASANAVAGTDGGSVVTLATALTVSTSGQIQLTGGNEYIKNVGKASASAILQSTGGIKLTGSGAPAGTVLTGAPESGLYQNLASTGTIITQTGKVPPVETFGGNAIPLPAVPVPYGAGYTASNGVAFVLSGAPPSNLDPLQAALLSSLFLIKPFAAPGVALSSAEKPNYCR